ncbi:hypothetical protein C8C83_3215 [Flavobacterium sp. 90]|nr:hypothetical protein C8C82_3525 [Flavobacterium sp. 81]TCK55262.1 hypothetical protein C8C83_3215 [Flavobacterium sp. 90]
MPQISQIKSDLIIIFLEESAQIGLNQFKSA